ncbi:MAG: type IV secretory system conjugative DNA transfer family protein [Clostridia bacterium]|nr:type IV secretory system conjugative DNA transfer family protein [Clostridia bacterium]
MAKKVCFYIFLFFCLILNIILDSSISNYFEILKKCFEKNIELTPNLYMLICSIIVLISILIILDILLVTHKQNKENKGIKFKEDDGTYGTANWMQEDEIKNILSFDKPGIILGKSNNKFIKLPFDSSFNKNIAVFGSSGSMKTIRIFTY